MHINCNIGGFDRFLRIGISLLMIYLGFFNDAIISDNTAGTILGIFGSASMLIALIGFCPFYALIGFNTCHKEHKNLQHSIR